MFGRMPREVPSVTVPLTEKVVGVGEVPVPDIEIVLVPLVWSPLTVSVPL
jgi:hypothetical protein